MAREASRTTAALCGCLVGTAVGDSVGLPFENLSRGSVGALMREPLRQSLAGRWGLVSDDTEHSVMVLLSLQDAGNDETRFARALARRLRWWMAALPPGVGGATARSILKLWFGVSPTRSGVMSAGNGAAMRSAVLGVVFADDPDRLERFVRASTWSSSPMRSAVPTESAAMRFTPCPSHCWPGCATATTSARQ